MSPFKSLNSQPPPESEGAQEKRPSIWERLKNKRIAYLTLPLLIVATLTEFVILATGWKYQQKACLPPGMGVTFFSIGPIGATILAVELLKLPLAIWTASRRGWTKGFMLVVGLPLICLLTFQLVKDMAVYEMGVAMQPASELLEQASAEEVKIVHLKGDLAAIEQKKIEREQTLAELAARKAKAKADLEEALKHNSDSRQDAISLTEYQQQALSEVEARQATIIKQFDADTEKLTQAIADLQARRETELTRATTWNAEEARLENEYNAKMAEYANQKAAYEKAKAEYEGANFLKRQLMRKPVDPGVPPVRETNTILKPAALAQLDEQIAAKEAELLTVNNKRRDRVAQVEDNARRIREDYDQRSNTKREEADRKREDLFAAYATLEAQLAEEVKQVDQEYQAAAQKVDGIRAQIDAARQQAEACYEAREEAIKVTQVHRIATTVEIFRGLIFGKRPVSITATAKERGDLYTDQISMVRIWVYPVLAFLVAFLPTLLVEIAFSTLFMPEQQQRQHRLGFLGRQLHWIEARAGRQKILQAERMAREATGEIAARDKALAEAQARADQALAEKDLELQAARDGLAAAEAGSGQRLEQLRAEHAAELKQKEEQWVAQLGNMADSLNRAIVEKDALRETQRLEIERQVQLRQGAWSERLNRLSQELDDQRAAGEAERTALMQEHHKKLMEVSEDCKTQVAQARRQVAIAELAKVESAAKLEHDLQEALNERDGAVTQMQEQTEALALKLAQAKEDAAHQLEKAARQEKHRLEMQQLEYAKALRQREEDFEHKVKQREQELALAFEARLMEEKLKIEQEFRRREAELQNELEERALETEARWNHEVTQRDEAAQLRFKQREQQLQAQAELRLKDAQAQADQELRRQKTEFERQLEAQAREAAARLSEALQQKELAHHNKLTHREQELTAKAAARESELQNQWAADLSAHQEAWEKQAESRVRAVEARLQHEAQHKEEMIQAGIRQRQQEWQAQSEARLGEAKAQWEQAMREREQEWENDAQARVHATEARWRTELQQKEELQQSKLRQREQHWQAKLEAARAEHQAQHEQALRRHEAQAEGSQRELEARLRQEMQLKEEAVQTEAARREQELAARLNTQAEARLAAAEEQWHKVWHSEAEAKIRAATLAFKTQLARLEKERDEAREQAAEAIGRVQEIEEQMSEATSYLSRRRNGNGKQMALATAGGHPY